MAIDNNKRTAGSGIEYKALSVWDGDGFGTDTGGAGDVEDDDDLNLGPAQGHFRRSPLHRYVGLFGKNDLEISTRRKRTSSWIKWLAMGVLFVLIISVIATLSVFVSGKSASNGRFRELGLERPDRILNNVSLEDVLSGRFSSRPFNGTWISDDEIQYMSDKGDLVIYNLTTKERRTLIPGYLLSTIGRNPPGKASLSPDRNFVLLSIDSQKIYRHSSYAKYFIYSILNESFSPLLPTKLDMGHGLLQLAEWSPIGNALVFIYANNLFYRPTAEAEESIQLTTDGNALVYNGVTDWVYEEEMFGSDKALWFSPNGQNIAFVTFNDTAVDLIQFPVYGEPGHSEYQYPMLEAIPYPKTGRSNPTAKVSIVSLPTAGSNQVKIFRDLQFPHVPNEHYVGTVLWATSTELLVVTLNRHQNDSRHHICDMKGRCETIFVDKIAGGWIDIETPKVDESGKDFITLTTQTQEGGTRYRHILRYSRDGIQQAVTSGFYSVDAILAWDQRNKRIYFTAPAYDFETKKSTPSQTHLYYVDDSASGSSALCLTCDTTNTHNQSCLANSFEISTEFSRTARSCSGPDNVPQVTIQNLKTLNTEEIWVDNTDVRNDLKRVGLPLIRDFDIPLPSGFVIKARLEIPPNFDRHSKYPLFVDVYGGPGSQKIADTYGIDWATSLVTSRSIIYASIDGRGSGRQSDDLKFQVYRRLGTVEIEDQIYAARWLGENVNFIDTKRTAIWGWSYGGYSTAMVMGTDYSGVYKCGISVAPVTSWLFYDTIYTERYMGLPTLTDNFFAYNQSDVTNHVENFKRKQYYLIHGNADDNVHYQQSMVLSRVLEKADILFRQQSYPDENHGLGGVRKHLYHSLESFLFKQCFQ